MSVRGYHGDVLALGVPDAVEDAIRDAAATVGLAVRTVASTPVGSLADAACVVCGHEPGRFDGLDALPTSSSTPVVFVPTDPEPAVATAAVEHDVDAYLPADVVREDPSALVDAVADAVEAPRSTNATPEAASRSTDGGVAADGTEEDAPGIADDADAAGIADGADADEAVGAADAADDAPFDAASGASDALGDVVGDPAVAEHLLAMTGDAAFVVDAASGAILYANPATEDVLGYDAAQLEGVHVTELHPPDAGDLMERVAGVLDVDDAGERRFDDVGGLELAAADGEVVPVAMRFDTVEVADRTLVTAVFRDVADRKARIEELERTERRLRNVTEAAFDIVFRLDATGEVESISGTVAEVLGYDPAAVVGTPFVDLIADSYVEQAMAAFEAASEGERFEELELHLETADGRRRIAHVNAIPVVVDGEFRGIEGTARDVTHQHRRERLLSVLNRVLRHNVRNAATVLLGHVDALAHERDGVDRHLNAIRETADDLVTLGEKSTRLRRAARNQDATEDVDPVAAAERAVEYVGADVDVDDDVPEDVTVGVGGELEFVVRELVTNAEAHAGGATAVRVREDEATVVVAVADDGDGIPRQERLVLEGGDESALEHGSGLGLWLVNWIATGAGGTVDVATGHDGSTVEVRLPKAEA